MRSLTILSILLANVHAVVPRIQFSAFIRKVEVNIEEENDCGGTEEKNDDELVVGETHGGVGRFKNIQFFSNWNELQVDENVRDEDEDIPTFGFVDNDDTLKCSGGLKMEIAGSDRSCRKCVQSSSKCDCDWDDNVVEGDHHMYRGSGEFWAALNPTQLYITSARPFLLGPPTATINFLKSKDLKSPVKVLYGNAFDNTHPSLRFEAYGQTKCEKTIQAIKDKMVNRPAARVVIIGDDGQGDILWAQCVRGGLKNMLVGSKAGPVLDCGATVCQQNWFSKEIPPIVSKKEKGRYSKKNFFKNSQATQSALRERDRDRELLQELQATRSELRDVMQNAHRERESRVVKVHRDDQIDNEKLGGKLIREVTDEGGIAIKISIDQY